MLEPRGARRDAARPPALARSARGSSLYVVAQIARDRVRRALPARRARLLAGRGGGVLAGIQVLAAALRIGRRPLVGPCSARGSCRCGASGSASSVTLALAAAVLEAPAGRARAGARRRGRAGDVAGTGSRSPRRPSSPAAARSGAAIGMQQTALSAAGASCRPAFAALVAATSWRTGFALAAVFPLVGVQLLRPLRSGLA